MFRFVPSLVFVVWLCAVPAVAAETAVAPAEPIAVAVEPKDDVAGAGSARQAVPAAESKATPQPNSPPSQPDPKAAPQFEGAERGLALEIEPFGWRVRLFGR